MGSWLAGVIMYEGISLPTVMSWAVRGRLRVVPIVDPMKGRVSDSNSSFMRCFCRRFFLQDL